MANLRAGTTVGGDAVFTVGNISSYGLNFLNGDVGIGTASPTTKLHVYGGARIERNGDSPLLQFTDQGSSNRWIGIPDGTQRFSIYANDGTTEHLAIDSGGNVGIGTESPSFLLDLVQKDGGVQLQMGRSNTAAGTAWMGADSSGFHLGVGAYGAGNSVEDPNGFTVDTNGNVGIGTTSPRCNLDLGLGNGDGSEVSNNAADYQLGLHAAQSTTGDIGRSIGFILSSGNVGAAITTADGGTGDATDLLFITGNSTSISEAMRIDSGGNVGIGTTDPGGYRLTVNGSANVQGTLHTDALFLKSSAYEMWHRNYTVRSDNPKVILQENGSEIDDGGAYRVTAHIPSTSTHNGATAVFWNSDGKWYVNQTVQPTHSSNHIGFYVTSDNKPTIQTWHTNDYNISVLHERVFLGESNTENTRFLFGVDGMISYKNDGHLYLNSFDSDDSSSSGNKILRQTSYYSGWEIYKVGSNGFIMGHNSTENTNFWLGANMTYDSEGWKSLEAGRSSWAKLGGSNSGDVFVAYSDLSTESGEIVNTEGNEMFKVTNTTTYDHGYDNVHVGNLRTYMNRSHVDRHAATDLPVGWYTIAQNTGNRASARFVIWDVKSGKHQCVTFYASHHYGTDASNTLTVLDNSYFSGNPFRYIRIKDRGTYDGAALQVYIDDASNAVYVAIVGDNVQSDGWEIVDFLGDASAPSLVSNWSSFGERARIDLNQIAQGGLATTGPVYADGDTAQKKLMNGDEVDAKISAIFSYDSSSGELSITTSG